MMYAYCRVSTEKQSLKRQTENIAKVYPQIAGSAFYCDKWTGTDQNRPAWKKLLGKVKAGDTIVFDSVSRMSRDAEAGAQQYEELYAADVNLIFLNEPHINTQVYREAAQAPNTGDKDLDETLIKGLNEYLMRLAKRQIWIAFEQAQKERDDIAHRVKDGMRAAQIAAAERGEVKTYGAKPGVKLTTKKEKAAKEIIRQYSKDFDGTLADTEVMKLAGCSRNSFYKYKRLLAEELS